jgi:hypothetical protein
MLDLPCDEEFWAADTAQGFYSRGGSRMADHNQVTFHDALGELLRTSEKQQQQHQNGQMFGSPNMQDPPKVCFHRAITLLNMSPVSSHWMLTNSHRAISSRAHLDALS